MEIVNNQWLFSLLFIPGASGFRDEGDRFRSHFSWPAHKVHSYSRTDGYRTPSVPCGRRQPPTARRVSFSKIFQNTFSVRHWRLIT